ncbi:MAG: GIY-YIG nuclease family protein [Acidobacteriaceae bacterium]
MKCVYFAQDEQIDRFMIGKTDDSSKRIKSHRTSNPSLKYIAMYETENPFPCETFLKKYFASRRIPGTKEFFSLPEQDSSIFDAAISAVKQFEKECLPKIKHAEEFKKVASDGTLVKPSSRARELYGQIRVVSDAIDRLNLQYEELESELKLTIGGADGIDGIATWKSEARTGFDFKVFEEENKEFVTEYEDIFRRYRTRTLLRKFCLK